LFKELREGTMISFSCFIKLPIDRTPNVLFQQQRKNQEDVVLITKIITLSQAFITEND
jgi:hypothetical protein